MRAMIRVKSRGRALRLARSVSSRRCITGAWGNERSACVIPTYTSRPPKLQNCKAFAMLTLLPVASTTTSHILPSVSAATAASSDASPTAVPAAAWPFAAIVSAIPILSRTKASRPAAMSITITRAPLSVAVELAGWHGEQPPQAAVAVDAERLVVLAAVGEPARAGVALLAVDVGLHAAAVARGHSGDIGADGHDLDPEFVPRDPRVAEKGHLAEVSAVVGSADADGMHANDGLARSGRRWFRDIDETKVFWLFEEQGLHEMARSLPGEVCTGSGAATGLLPPFQRRIGSSRGPRRPKAPRAFADPLTSRFKLT